MLHILRRLRRDWLGWLKGVAVDSVLTGALTYGARTRPWLVFAVLTGLLEVVPYFGPILAAVLPTLTQSVELALLTLALFTVIQQVEGNVIVPLVMSQAVRLHPRSWRSASSSSGSCSASSGSCWRCRC